MKYNSSSLNTYIYIAKIASKKRLARLREAMSREDLCGIILFENDPIAYKLVLTEHFNLIVLLPNTVYVLSDPTLYSAALEESPWNVILIKDFTLHRLVGTLLEILKECATRKPSIGVNKAWGRTRLSFLYIDLLEALRLNKINVLDATTILTRVFDKPFEEEIAIVEWISEVGSRALEAVEEVLKPGLREYEVAAIADKVLSENGIVNRWFQTIVASGPRAAVPHAKTSGRKIAAGDPVIIDLGPLWMGYDGCIAYTFIAGSNGAYWRHVLRDVIDAIRAGLEYAKPDTPVRALDEAPRQFLTKHGYPDYPHLTGHPIGGFYKPVIASFIDYKLEPGMVFAYEPSVYLPGRGGVRVEPHIIIHSNGYRILTRYHTQLIP